MKISIYFIAVCAWLIECAKTNNVELENNFFKAAGKTYSIYSCKKHHFISPTCSGKGLVGGLNIYAASANKDTFILFVYNLKNFETTQNIVDGKTGILCEADIMGVFKSKDGKTENFYSKDNLGQIILKNNNYFEFKTVYVQMPTDIWKVEGKGTITD